MYFANRHLHLDLTLPQATEEDGSKIKDDGSLDKAAEMFGVDVADMRRALTSRKIGFDCVVAYNCQQASDARDALTKCIFEKLFNYLVTLVNKALDFGGDGDADLLAKTNQINVLDIFGFETFDTNSFEQLCINYCNEKLQSHFNEHIFKLEQDEYEREGRCSMQQTSVNIEVPVDFTQLTIHFTSHHKFEQAFRSPLPTLPTTSPAWSCLRRTVTV